MGAIQRKIKRVSCKPALRCEHSSDQLQCANKVLASVSVAGFSHCAHELTDIPFEAPRL